ncbi:DNA polymerase III subunits gamma and tau [Paraburkholderia piptadeniae]|uniref:DNA polymerase III subunit gamma/tau n=1 Tax=Paraburkholderia piptadeniae TaxID=1701573 RepID=A0A1N7S815_9BURK|nr:DNA polymerase III subunit gamma/tau [Paraburkholderia piptadeniae]SIT43470.1 DNA polymerase III subunits gamma and tau [Paraburkholderia piptadeniae]
MTYQVLARKWRPKDFASLVGQEHVVRALTHALDGGRLHHAYLFTGTRGVGKTTLSRIFAKALNCETGVTATPCGVCRACREIDEGRFVDYVEMDAASNRGVDEMAALLERAVYAPVDARFKVYMIDEVHMLTNHAFNAMLKTLEEPPPHVKFLLATTDPQKIPVTVLSRCLQFNLKQMPAGHIVSHLERILGEENIPHEAQALRLLARAADGSMRDALSLTDQAIAYSANQLTEEAVRGMLGALDQSYLIRLLDALVAGDGAAVLSVADEMALRSLSFSTALQDLAGLLHKIAWAQYAPSSVLEEWPEAADLRRFADALSPEQVQLFYQIATIGRSELGLAPDEYAGFTMTLLRMLAFEPAPNGGGGGVTPAGRSTVPAAAGSKRAGAPVAAAPVREAQAHPIERPAAAPKPESAAAQPKAVSEAAEIATAATVDAGVTPMMSAAGSKEVDEASTASNASEASPSNPATPDDNPPAQAAAVPQRQSEAAPRRAGGASAALDVLRNAGMKVSTDRGASARSAAPAAAASPAPTAKPAAPRVAVRVPTPDPARRAAAAAQQETAARTLSSRGAQQQGGSSVPPWEDIPPDDYIPASSDDAFFAPADDNFIPVFDSGPDDVVVARGSASAAAPAPAPVVDVRTLPPAVPLNAIGFDGDWPALAVTLSLKGISYQLAFNSELMAVEGKTLKLNVAVQLYAEPAQIAKLKAALAERLGSEIDVQVDVGPVQRTAAVLDAIERAKRQREAEREIGADPFVQSLIREFGASIVPGSVRPLTPGADGGQDAASH